MGAVSPSHSVSSSYSNDTTSNRETSRSKKKSKDRNTELEEKMKDITKNLGEMMKKQSQMKHDLGKVNEENNKLLKSVKKLEAENKELRKENKELHDKVDEFAVERLREEFINKQGFPAGVISGIGGGFVGGAVCVCVGVATLPTCLVVGGVGAACLEGGRRWEQKKVRKFLEDQERQYQKDHPKASKRAAFEYAKEEFGKQRLKELEKDLKRKNDYHYSVSSRS